MKIVIEIPEEMIISLEQGSFGAKYNMYDLVGCVMNGTPLPEHHGRIIDESKIKKVYYHIETSEYKRFRIEHAVIDGTDAPTIIERSDGNEYME